MKQNVKKRKKKKKILYIKNDKEKKTDLSLTITSFSCSAELIGFTFKLQHPCAYNEDQLFTV